MIEVKQELGARQRDGAVFAKLLSLGVPAKQAGKGVYRVDTEEHGVVMYYPSTGRWQRRGRVYSGTVEQFASWFKALVTP